MKTHVYVYNINFVFYIAMENKKSLYVYNK